MPVAARLDHPGCLLCLLAIVAAAPARADDAPGQKTVTHVIGDDVFTAGGRVRVTQPSAGDAIAAGSDLSITGAVGGDVVAVGRTVTLRSAIEGDVYAAGADVRIAGTVAGNARVAGARVELEPQAGVDGALSVAGREVDIGGRVGRYLQVAAGTTHLNGYIAGDVEVSGEQLDIGPDAVVDGAVRFRGPAPARVDAGAQVRGGVQHVPARSHGEAEVRGGIRKAFGAGAWLWLAGWLVAGCILIAALPGVTRGVAQAAHSRPGRSLLMGLLALFGVPVLVLILMVTLVGIPLGLLLLAVYLLWLLLGYLAAVLALGDGLLARLRAGREPAMRERILAFGAVLVVLFLLVRIPVLGALLVFLLLLAGMGSLAVAALGRRHATAAAQ